MEDDDHDVMSGVCDCLLDTASSPHNHHLSHSPLLTHLIIAVHSIIISHTMSKQEDDDDHRQQQKQEEVEPAIAPRRSTRVRRTSQVAAESIAYVCDIESDDDDDQDDDDAVEIDTLSDREDDVDDHVDDDAGDDEHGEDDDEEAVVANDDDDGAAAVVDDGDGGQEQQQRRSRSSSSAPSRPMWRTDKDVIVTCNRRRAPSYPPNTRTDRTPFQVLQSFITNIIIDRWRIYTSTLWHDDDDEATTIAARELWAFIATHIYMGIVRLPRLDMYWQQDTQQRFVNELFSRNRFQLLLRYFSIADPRSVSDINNVVEHTSSFINHLNHTFPLYYAVTRPIVIDESIVAYAGRNPLKQYMKGKPHPYGFKVYGLASNHYLRRIELYRGAAAVSGVGSSVTDLCLRLVQGYEHNNHILYTNSWFSSPTLLVELRNRGIALCGSTLVNRVGMPHKTQLSSTITHRMQRNDQLHFLRDDMCVVAWKDKKAIVVLYNHLQPTVDDVTLHRRCKHGGHYDIQAPAAVQSYFKYMRSVDVVNQKREAYPIGRKSKRARWRLVWWLIDMCIVNAYTVWSYGRDGTNQLDFRKQLMYEMSHAFRQERAAAEESAAAARGAVLLRDHYPVMAGTSADCAFKQHHTENRARPSYVCSACGVHLCIDPCFHLYNHKA